MFFFTILLVGFKEASVPKFSFLGSFYVTSPGYFKVNSVQLSWAGACVELRKSIMDIHNYIWILIYNIYFPSFYLSTGGMILIYYCILLNQHSRGCMLQEWLVLPGTFRPNSFTWTHLEIFYETWERAQHGFGQILFFLYFYIFFMND